MKVGKTAVENSDPQSQKDSAPADSTVTADKAFSRNVGTPAPENQPVSDQPNQKPKKPLLVIVLAIVIAVTLAAAAVYAYMQSNKSDTDEQTNTTADTVDGTDVNGVSDEIDQAIDDVDNSEDFPEDELSDSTLGL